MKKIQTLLVTTALTSSLALLSIPVALADAKHNSHGHGHGGDHGHSHDDTHINPEPHHGGIVSIVDNYHHELLIENNNKVVVYAEGLPEGEALKKVQLDLILLQGNNKQKLKMKPTEGNGNRFEVSLDTKLKSGYKVVVLIKQEDKKVRMVRFEISVK